MKRVTITINTTGPAFENFGGPLTETAWILHKLASRFKRFRPGADEISQTLLDSWGNTCGTVVIESEEGE